MSLVPPAESPTRPRPLPDAAQPARHDGRPPVAPAAPLNLVAVGYGGGLRSVAEDLSRPGLPDDVAVLVMKRRPWARYRRVLVGVDLVAGSLACVRTALLLAPAARCTALHLVPPAGVRAVTPRNAEAARAEVRRRALTRAEQRLRATLAGLPAVEIAVGPGTPGNVLPDLARVFGFDLVVLGGGRDRCLRQLLLGAVTRRVVEQAPCDVAIVPRLGEPTGSRC